MSSNVQITGHKCNLCPVSDTLDRMNRSDSTKTFSSRPMINEAIASVGSPTKAAEAMGIGRATMYRGLEGPISYETSVELENIYPKYTAKQYYDESRCVEDAGNEPADKAEA